MARRGSPDDGFDVRGVVRQLWRSRVLLMAATILAGVAAGTVSLLSPRLYSATAALLLSRSKIGTEANAEALLVTNFLPLIENSEVATEVIKRFKLDGPPYKALPDTFFETLVTVEPVRMSSVIDITARMQNPELAANVVNTVAQLGVETARRVSQDEAVQARNDIKAQLDEAKARLDVAENALQKGKTSHQVDLLKKDADEMLKERGGFLALTIEIEAEKAKLAKAEGELAQRKQIDIVRRTIINDPAMMAAARAVQPSTDVLGLQLQAEEISPVYRDIDKAVADSRARLAGLEKEKTQMLARHLDQPSLPQLTDLYTKETLVDRLEMERDLAKKVYQDVAISYESARLLVAGRSSALHVISAAMPPETAESRKIARNTLIGLISGFLVAAIAVILRYALLGESPHGVGAHP
jgi:uncharacterized protein involved in exopolysaccharide biosynthesis